MFFLKFGNLFIYFCFCNLVEESEKCYDEFVHVKNNVQYKLEKG